MRHSLGLKKLLLLAASAFTFQLGGCAITETIGALFGSLLSGV